MYGFTERDPYLLVEWHDTGSCAVGWLVVYNFVNNFCSGGTRMHPSVTAEEVYRLARAMAYKYKACESATTGGCKAGIRYDSKAPDAREVLKRFMIAMTAYMRHGVNLGGDLGVDALEVFRIWDEIGVIVPQTKAMRGDPRVIEGTRNHDLMCDMTLDRFKVYDMITGYGVAHGADELWRLRTGRRAGGARVVIQGFGCLGASCAYLLEKMGYSVVGIADANCLVECPEGLDINRLLDGRLAAGEMNPASFDGGWRVSPNAEWLEVDCDILIPAALEDVINRGNAGRVRAGVVVEGANICTTPEADLILARKGVDIGVDFTVNLGATRYYDSIIFGVIGPDPQAAIDDVEAIIRKDVRLVYNGCRVTGKRPREVAETIFKPDTFTYPDN